MTGDGSRKDVARAVRVLVARAQCLLGEGVGAPGILGSLTWHRAAKPSERRHQGHGATDDTFLLESWPAYLERW